LQNASIQNNIKKDWVNFIAETVNLFACFVYNSEN